MNLTMRQFHTSTNANALYHENVLIGSIYWITSDMYKYVKISDPINCHNSSVGPKSGQHDDAGFCTWFLPGTGGCLVIDIYTICWCVGDTRERNKIARLPGTRRRPLRHPSTNRCMNIAREIWTRRNGHHWRNPSPHCPVLQYTLVATGCSM